jgi:hypothetical protein
MIISSIQKTDTFSNATTFTNPIPLLIKKKLYPKKPCFFILDLQKWDHPMGGIVNSYPSIVFHYTVLYVLLYLDVHKIFII